ncbi:hypothetical protein VMCG_01607 [Cytospora schulzeri]|uniref:DUF8035 domain-containing protein n=1 Tax=Cytospora schulzeri TaxID=448051 RepID=A0A423X3T1_9PEZI|nr:hypothetical protein VMCG_01607 [Valsa malicola]
MPDTYRRYEERDTYYDDEPPRGPPSRRPASSRGGDDVLYDRREARSPPPGHAARRSDVQVSIRDREDIDRESRVPHFLRDDARRPEAGPLVLRQRDVETVERARPRPRSPSRDRMSVRMRARSVSPGPPEREEIRARIHDHSRERVRSPSRGPALDRVRLGTRIIERPERSPSPPAMDRLRTRFDGRERSPSPRPELERSMSRIRITEKEREREPSPAPPAPEPEPEQPLVIKGPTIEREVITHYRDIDHGMVLARPPSPPPPPPRRVDERETDIDIYTGRNETEIDITRTRSRSRGPRASSRPRARSVSRPPRPMSSYDPLPKQDRPYYHDDEIIINSGHDKLKIDIDHERRSASARPRARSAAPGFDDEAEYITGKLDSRGHMGEAWGGATKDWTLVDVPPGTERVRMDGVGGGAAEVTWQKYSGSRRSKFIPERSSDGALVPLSPPASSSTVISDREGYAPPRDGGRDRLSVQIYDKDREVDVERTTDRRISLKPSLPAPAPAPKSRDMWTEVTKDLVVREAIEEAGYDYDETDVFFYIMQYLRYEDVLELVEISDRIRARRKDRIREIQYEREIRDDYDRTPRHRHRPRWEDERERVVEREVIFDSGRPRRY